MIKIIGNILTTFILLFSSFVILDAQIIMKIRTENNEPNQVIVGQPFTLEVIIDDVYGTVKSPVIKGLDGCSLRLIGTSSTTINGKSNARYSYSARIDKLGEYTIGPAMVHSQQQELSSAQLHISVVKDAGVTIQKNKNNNSTTNKAFLRLMVDTETPFIGQKINCSLRFYYQDVALSLQAIGIPELSGFDIKETSALETGTTEIDGVPYHYAQWRWDMYPTKTGEFLIPAYHADYEVPTKETTHPLGGFFIFMNSRVDRKRVYSNAITVKVSPLPHYDGPVHAIGSFERISADIQPGIVKEGEGTILTIEVEGTGNLSAITFSPLNIPHSLKCYDSNNTIITPKHADELPKKRFEFIVQAMKAGDYEIPEQLFTYFDTEKNAYITLRTSALAVSAISGPSTIKKEIITDKTLSPICKDNELADINRVGPWYPVAERNPLPWWIFELLFLLPCFYCVYPLFKKRFFVVVNSSTWLKRKYALRQAYRKIEYCKKNNNNKELHGIFVQLLKHCNEAIDIHSIKRVLQESNISPEIINEWNTFFERITYAAYAQSDNDDIDELCRMAKQWLKRLEKNI